MSHVKIHYADERKKGEAADKPLDQTCGRWRSFLPWPAPAVIATCPRCHLDLPPLSSRPAPAVIATCPRCHLDRRERSLQGRISAERQDFSLRFEMTAGEASRPSPCRELQYFSLAFKMTAGYHQVLLPIGNTLRPNNLCRLDLPPLSSQPGPAVIATYPRCRLDLPPLSSRLALWLVALSCRVISNCPRCHLGLPSGLSPFHAVSSRPAPAVISTAGRDLCRAGFQRKDKISRCASK